MSRADDTRSQRIANTRQGIADAKRAGEHDTALALTSALNQLIAADLAEGRT